MMQPDEQQDIQELRGIQLEVADTLEAVIIALQAQRAAQSRLCDPRSCAPVVQLRQHLDALEARKPECVSTGDGHFLNADSWAALEPNHARSLPTASTPASIASMRLEMLISVMG